MFGKLSGRSERNDVWREMSTKRHDRLKDTDEGIPFWTGGPGEEAQIANFKVDNERAKNFPPNRDAAIAL
jgi:hypothetical protein